MTTRHLRRALLGTIALGGLVTAPAIALAEAASSTQVAAVVVTAQKRAEKLQDTPVSVSVVSGVNLEATQATSMADWSSYVPGLALGAGGSPGLVNLSLDGIGPLAAAPAGTMASFPTTPPFKAFSVATFGKGFPAGQVVR